MEMAAAHGLALKLVEMSRLDRINRNELREIISEEDKIIKSWMTTNHPRFRKCDYFYLLRKTLLFILNESPLKEIKKKELLKVVSKYFNTFSSLLKSNMDVRKPVIDFILDPWRNVYFIWEELFQKKINFRDQKVQEYFCVEPEEIVLARVHKFMQQGKEEIAMILAKNSFLFHSRIAKHFTSEYQRHIQKKPNSFSSNKYKKGTASVIWYLFILQRKKVLPSIVSEVKQLSCHEGVLLVQQLRKSKKNQGFAFTLLQIFLMQELIRPSQFCCTKKIFCLWCLMHKERKSSMDNIIEEIRKMVAMYAPSSAHFYLLVDALWNQFGSSFITVYVELYVRGLTVDLNHLEAARNGEVQDDVSYLECHIASMFAKLSTLFSDFHEGAARECMFSAFSLKPTKERLYILQSLTHSILSSENEMKSSLNGNSLSTQECNCAVRCNGSCSSTNEYSLEHPILMKGISNVPYFLVKDLVSVLEGVRCIRFQYNLFDWHNNATDLGDYLKDFNLAKSWESDTEYASDGSVKSDIEETSPVNDSLYQATQMDVESVQQPVKRKSESDDIKEMFSLDIGANIEVTNDEFVNKRIKVQDQNTKEISKHEIFNAHRKPIQNFSPALGMEDAIENVIRMTLDNKNKSDIPLNISDHNALLNASLNHANDGTENLSLSSAYKPVSENHVYPYSLTTYGKKNNLTSNFKAAECSSSVNSNVASTAKYASSFASKPPSSMSQMYVAPPIASRESVISPAINNYKKSVTMLNEIETSIIGSYKQTVQNKFLPIKTVNVPSYSRSKDTSAPSVENLKRNPVYQQVALNLGTQNATYEQVRNVSNRVTQSSQFISNQTAMQVLHKSDISATSDVSKTQFLSNTSIASASSMTSPVNVIQSKDNVAAQHAGYPSSSHSVPKSSSVFRTDSRYQLDNNSRGDTVVKRVEQSVSCFQDNSFVHCDRSSVIQHTMQHARENPAQSQFNDIEMPNQLSVSLNSNAIEQIRSAPNKDITNLPPFTVNVSDRTISNSSVAVSASLVIPRKPQSQIGVASHQPVIGNTVSVNNNETITIPGILASQSVIVSPWEAQRKSHGEFLYKKNINAINSSNMDKRIYKNRPPYARPVLLKTEPNANGHKAPSDKSNNTQGFKAIAPPSHISSSFLTLPSSNQTTANTSQVWSAVNKSSTQGVSQCTSSQPWYSEPYPKPNNGNNIASKASGGLNLTVQQNVSSIVKPLQSTKHAVDVKPCTLFTNRIHPSNTHSSVSSTVSYSPNNSVSSSSTKSSVLNISTFSSPNSNPRAASNDNILHKDFISAASPSFHPNSRVHIKTYGIGNNPVRNNYVEPSGLQTSVMQLSTGAIQDKNQVLYTTPDVMGTNLHYSHIPSNYPNSCCSPSEVNPCQNCSLPAENNLVQFSHEKNSERHPEQMIQGSNRMLLDGDLASAAPCDSEFSNKSRADGLVCTNLNVNSTLANCQYCSHPFLATELEMHILNSHPKELDVKSNNFISEINSDMMLTENLCAKSLSVVPETDSLFQKESFHNDLPHAKTFVSSVGNNQSVNEDDDLEAHAFSACMDLINNDKDLKRIVQGIDSLQQMDNNYLPFLPCNDSSNNFLTSNMCAGISLAPVQNSAVNDKSEEFDDVPGCQQTQLQENKLEVGKSLNCVFEFTEREFDSSKPIQKLIHSKLQSSYLERISANTSKTSNELTFSALAEMIKVSITDDPHDNLESAETCIKDGQKDVSHSVENPQKVDLVELSCPFCSKILRSPWTLKRHILKFHPNLPVNNSQKTTSPKLTDISSPNYIPDSNFQLENDITSKSENSYNVNSDSLNNVLHPDVKPSLEISSTSEICGILPKGRIKGFIKSPTSQCKICQKVLTASYMKRHILTQHQEVMKKTENSSSDGNIDVNLSSPSQVDFVNIPRTSPLLEQDIDSSTCLSMSDALKRNPYTVADTSNLSESSDKLIENPNIKFNFNVLEFSKDAKICSKLPTKEDINLKFGQPPPESVSGFEENKIKSNIPHTEKIKINQDKCCHLCPKAYTAVSTLNRHLKTVHNFVIPRSTGKNKGKNNLMVPKTMKNVGENKPLQSTVFHKVSGSNIENIHTSNKKTAVQYSGAPHAENSPSSQIATDLLQKVKEKLKKPLPNLNKSLLRTVLNSNFVSKQLEIKEPGESSYRNNNAIDNDKINTCDISEREAKKGSVQSSGINCSYSSSNYECLTRSTLDAELKSNDKVFVSVPFDNLSKTLVTEGSKECSSALIPDSKASSHSSKFEISHQNNELHKNEEGCQMKYTQIDSQNLSIQSNEISPISDIISNVSKCHFGGTSNNDCEKELFEENSLKLLIPENQDESLSIRNDDESIHQSFITELTPKQELPLDENCLNISDASERFKVLNELAANDISSEGENLENESCELENTKNISYASEKFNLNELAANDDISSEEVNLENELCELENTKNITDVSERFNEVAANKDVSSEGENLKNEFCELENTKNIIDASERFNELAANDDVSSEGENLKNKLCKLENTKNISDASERFHELAVSDDVSSEGENIENESCELENTKNISDASEGFKELNELAANDDDISSKGENILNESCELENTENISDPSERFKELNELAASDDISSEGEYLENESCELENTIQNSDAGYMKCRLCNQNLSSMDFLSKHLKEVHDIPVLKKHISHPSSPELSAHFQEPDKLSPPKLKLGPNESDSESDFDNTPSWSKATNSSGQDALKNEALFEDKLCVSLSPSKQCDQDEETILNNSPPKLKKTFMQLELAEKEIELLQPDSLTLQPLNLESSNSECQLKTAVPSASEFRRHSISDLYSVLNENINSLVCKSKHLSFDLKSTFCNNVKQKSASLPNLKFTLLHEAPSQIAHSTNHMLDESKEIEADTTSSSVTDNTEICKSSCDSSSFQNCPVQWNKITIKSSFLLPTPLISSSLAHRKSTKNKKISRRKLLLRKLKSFKKEKKRIKRKIKATYFPCHKKFKSKKAFKPIVLTLKEATEISDFLKTHKQPTVKLIRLKENESSTLINQKDDTISNIICNKYDMKEAVVKLERIHIPNDFHGVVVINQNIVVPNLLSQDTHTNSLTMQIHENQSLNSPNGFYLDLSSADISQSEVSVTNSNPPEESIQSLVNELDSTTSSSSDSVEYLRTVTKEEKCQIKTEERCTSPLTRNCCVLLNRISM